MSESIANLLSKAAALQRLNKRVLGCLLVQARGSTPQSAGALMLVDEDATTYGTIGGGCVEAEVRRRALDMLSEHRTGLMRFKLDHDYGWDDGLICGGTVTLAVGTLPDAARLDQIRSDIEHRRATELRLDAEVEGEPAEFILDLPPRDRLYIAGAGHVGQALALMALRLEFEVSLFDDRSDLLEKLSPPDCRRIAGNISEQLSAAPIDSRTFAVIVTRGHKHDEQALHAVLNRGAAYVGMIGSRRKVKLIFDDLRQMGVSAEALADVCAPIGLDIGAVSVEEIALSIAGELIQRRRSESRSPVRVPEALLKSFAARCE